MNSFARSAANSENALSRASIHITNSYGRSPAYRRLASQLSQASKLTSSGASQKTASALVLSPLRSQFLPSELRSASIVSSQYRQFHVSRTARQEDKPAKDSAKSATTEANAEAEAEAKKSESETKTDEEQSKKSEEGENGEKSEGKEEGKEKKEDMPPPPPHGDKTPWQVFMETMNTEFQASKEWNESTKQIGAAAHQFTESESVRRAREAYEKSTGAISSTTAKAVKSTAGAIGKGAAWTWDTSVMKGVRKAANVTGDAVDKATKPIRETEAYRNVKDVIDDGSSSRYGGWVEKEERRKKRQMMEQQGGSQSQVMEEDPK